MNKVVDKMININMKLNEEYFYSEINGEWVLNRNKMFFYRVMDSKNNTEEELNKFIKEHRTYNYNLTNGFVNIMLCLTTTILSIINIKLNSIELRCFINGMLIVLLVNALSKIIINSHNDEVKDKIYHEDIEYLKSLEGKKNEERIIKSRSK